MNFTHVEGRIVEFQPLGTQPVGVPCFVSTDQYSIHAIDIGVWDGNEWTTEFGHGEPIGWAPISVARDAMESDARKAATARLTDTICDSVKELLQ